MKVHVAVGTGEVHRGNFELRLKKTILLFVFMLYLYWPLFCCCFCVWNVFVHHDILILSFFFYTGGS